MDTYFTGDYFAPVQWKASLSSPQNLMNVVSKISGVENSS